MKQVYWDYLESLRKSGVTNMFGAAQFLEDQFELSRQEAKKVLLDWMQSYQRNIGRCEMGNF